MKESDRRERARARHWAAGVKSIALILHARKIMANERHIAEAANDEDYALELATQNQLLNLFADADSEAELSRLIDTPREELLKRIQSNLPGVH